MCSVSLSDYFLICVLFRFFSVQILQNRSHFLPWEAGHFFMWDHRHLLLRLAIWFPSLTDPKFSWAPFFGFACLVSWQLLSGVGTCFICWDPVTTFSPWSYQFIKQVQFQAWLSRSLVLGCHSGWTCLSLRVTALILLKVMVKSGPQPRLLW